jgi:hypothetical protein
MPQRSVVVPAAWLEIVIGTLFAAVPNLPCVLLFATKPERLGVPIARFAGLGLLALGIACLPTSTTGSRRGVVGLLVFNIGAAILFAWVGVATTLRGILLWPAVFLHAAIAAALMARLLTTA